jgi:CheY-like chemotaxis protein
MHIVHLEDRKPLRDMLKSILDMLSPECIVQQFATGDEAADYVRQYGQEVDLFLLDMRVPGSVDGLGVAELIQQSGCSGVIVLTSAYNSPGQHKLAALNAHWFQKPWGSEEIQEMLHLASMRPTS